MGLIAVYGSYYHSDFWDSIYIGIHIPHEGWEGGL